jgi:hypothetical protein
MRRAVDNFQRLIFTVLLFTSSCSGLIADLVGMSGRGGFYIVFDVTIIFLALLSISRVNRGMAMVLLFIVAVIGFNFSYNGNSLSYSLNGIREILNVLCLAVFFGDVFSDENQELAAEYVEVFKKFAAFFVVAQVPVAAYQFSIHGPSDWVGGTYGNFGSGNMTLSVICLVFFLSHFVRNLTQRMFLYACLVPLFLNETKVSFILIPALILFIHFKPKAKSIIGAGLAAGAALFIFNKYFTTNIGTDFDNNLTGIFSKDFIDGYLFGDAASYGDVPRFTKIILAWQLLAQDTVHLLFGFEYGVFRGGEVVEVSHFSQSVQWLMTGTRPYLFFLMIQGGMLLVAGFLLLIGQINRFFVKHNNKYKLFLFILFVVILFYNDALRSHNILIVYMFSIFYANSTLYNEQLEEYPEGVFA